MCRGAEQTPSMQVTVHTICIVVLYVTMYSQEHCYRRRSGQYVRLFHAFKLPQDHDSCWRLVKELYVVRVSKCKCQAIYFFFFSA